jgi:hypothetical protein
MMHSTDRLARRRRQVRGRHIMLNRRNLGIYLFAAVAGVWIGVALAAAGVTL